MAKGQRVRFPEEFRERCVTAIEEGMSLTQVSEQMAWEGKHPAVSTVQKWYQSTERAVVAKGDEWEEKAVELWRLEGKALRRIEELMEDSGDLKELGRIWNLLFLRAMDLQFGRHRQAPSGIKIDKALFQGVNLEELQKMALRGPAADEKPSAPMA